MFSPRCLAPASMRSVAASRTARRRPRATGWSRFSDERLLDVGPIGAQVDLCHARADGRVADDHEAPVLCAAAGGRLGVELEALDEGLAWHRTVEVQPAPDGPRRGEDRLEVAQRQVGGCQRGHVAVRSARAGSPAGTASAVAG
jgi:hypothetical protein